MTERVKKSPPNPTWVFTSKKKRNFTNKPKNTKYRYCSWVWLHSRRSWKIFSRLCLQHPRRWTANTPKLPLGELFPTALHPRKKKPSKNTCWYTISSYFLYQSPGYIWKATEHQCNLCFSNGHAKWTLKKKDNPSCPFFILVKCYFFHHQKHCRDVPMRCNKEMAPAYWISWLVTLRRKRVLNRNLPASVKSD